MNLKAQTPGSKVAEYMTPNPITCGLILLLQMLQLRWPVKGSAI